MILLAEGSVNDPATILGQWIGIAVGAITLLLVAVGTGVNLQRIANQSRELRNLREDFHEHEKKDDEKFAKVESWHRRVIVAIAKSGGIRPKIIDPGEHE